MKEEERLLAEQEQDQFDIRGFLLKLLAYWPLIVTGVVLALAAAYFYTKFQTPIYQLSSTVLIGKDEQGGWGRQEGFIKGQELLMGRKDVTAEKFSLKTQLACRLKSQLPG